MQIATTVHEFVDGVSLGYATIYMGSALLELSNDTLQGYGRELRKYAVRITRHKSFEEQILHLVRPTASNLPLKKLLSGVWVPNTICQGDWVLVDAIDQFKRKSNNAAAKMWATMEGSRGYAHL